MAQQSQRDAIIESIIKLTDEEIQSLSHGKLKEYRKSFQSLPFPSMRMEWSPSTDGLRKEFISSRNMLGIVTCVMSQSQHKTLDNKQSEDNEIKKR
eukprot:251633_1